MYEANELEGIVRYKTRRNDGWTARCCAISPARLSRRVEALVPKWCHKILPVELWLSFCSIVFFSPGKQTRTWVHFRSLRMKPSVFSIKQHIFVWSFFPGCTVNAQEIFQLNLYIHNSWSDTLHKYDVVFMCFFDRSFLLWYLTISIFSSPWTLLFILIWHFFVSRQSRRAPA